MTKGKVRRDQRDFQVSIGDSLRKMLSPFEGTKEALGIAAEAETLGVDFASTTVGLGCIFQRLVLLLLLLLLDVSEGKGDAGSFRLPVAFSLHHQG